MYAIVDVKDKQFKVREDDTLYVPYHSEAGEDEELVLDRVLLVSDGEGDVTIGTPTVDNASVTARVVEHVKGDKVIVFKKKRRKRYRVKRGHRQQYTQIHIDSLDVNGASAAPGIEAADEKDALGGADASSPDVADPAGETETGVSDASASDEPPSDEEADADESAADETETENENSSPDDPVGDETSL